MQYEGKLYGKVGKSYFPLEETTEDVERLRLNKWTDTDMMSFTEWTQIEEWIFIATINPFWKCAKEKSKHFGEEKTTAQLLKDWKLWKEANK